MICEIYSLTTRSIVSPIGSETSMSHNLEYVFLHRHISPCDNYVRYYEGIQRGGEYLRDDAHFEIDKVVERKTDIG